MGNGFRDRGGRPHLLTCDDATIGRFHGFGQRGVPLRGCALELGVHRQTVSEFLQRCPAANAAYERGAVEWRARHPDEKPVALIRAPRPKRGETCPTCGHRDAEEENQIILTPATIAEAQRTLDDLIDRHLAARGADDAAEPGQ